MCIFLLEGFIIQDILLTWQQASPFPWFVGLQCLLLYFGVQWPYILLLRNGVSALPLLWPFFLGLPFTVEARVKKLGFLQKTCTHVHKKENLQHQQGLCLPCIIISSDVWKPYSIWQSFCLCPHPLLSGSKISFILTSLCNQTSGWQRQEHCPRRIKLITHDVIYLKQLIRKNKEAIDDPNPNISPWLLVRCRLISVFYWMLKNQLQSAKDST